MVKKTVKNKRVSKVDELERSTFAAIKIQNVISVILIVSFAILISVNLFSLFRIKSDIRTYIIEAGLDASPTANSNKNNLIANGDAVSSVTYNWQSFGDNFSSDAYLDKTKTTMFLDDSVTSLSFPPRYDFNLVKKCEQATCDLSATDLIFTDQIDTKKSPRVPDELKDSTILSSRLSNLSSLQVASFVVKNNGEESGYIYFYDGKKFTPIIGLESSEKITTKYGRSGGIIAVGGDDNDFLILYAGYEAQAWHYKDGRLSDVSKFFGLRVAAGGFNPYIIKQGSGNNSLWYVLSLNSAKPKLIKLWQNNGEEIVGAYDFSHIFSASDGVLSSFGIITRGELEFIFKQADNTYSLKNFTDSGFDNSTDRLACSVNLNSNQEIVAKARIKSLGLSGQASLFLANVPDHLIPTEAGKDTNFNELGHELFWQINFSKSDNPEYSPWLDHINYLDYFLAKN